MAVPRNKRGTSTLEWFENARRIREMIYELATCDFGLRIKKKKLKQLQQEYDIVQEDMDILSDILFRYEISPKILRHVPYWFLEDTRDKLISRTESLMYNIRAADSFTVKSDYMHNLRQQHIVQAIACTFSILDLLEFLQTHYLNTSKPLLLLIEALMYETHLLKNLQRRDDENYKKRRQKVMKGEKAAEAQHTPVQGIGTAWTNYSMMSPGCNPFDADAWKYLTKENKGTRNITKDDIERAIREAKRFCKDRSTRTDTITELTEKYKDVIKLDNVLSEEENTLLKEASSSAKELTNNTTIEELVKNSSIAQSPDKPHIQSEDKNKNTSSLPSNPKKVKTPFDE